jgi:tRNA (guanine37-N1)-methyltransferase
VPRYDVLTLHPEMVRAPLTGSVIGRAIAAGILELGIHDIRAHGLGRHRSVDDTPYGGGAGMVMRVDVVAAAIAAVRIPESRVLLLSAAGPRFDHDQARRHSALPHHGLVCGPNEGVDARVETLVDEELSIGDFVLTGGEIAAVAIVDAVARLVPGVLGNAASSADESFTTELLEYPQYTRPRTFEGHDIPEVLVSGHHDRILRWRENQSRLRTRDRRPDLWERYVARVGAVDVREDTD